MDVNFLASLDDLNKDPEHLLREWKQNAARGKADFRSKKLQHLKVEDPDQFVESVQELFKAAAMFINDDIKKELINIGLGWLVLQWMVPIEKILVELDRIEESGQATLSRTSTLVYIKNHLDVNWLTDLQATLGYTQTVNKREHSAILKSIIHRLYRNRNKDTGQFAAAKNREVQKIIDMIYFLEAQTGLPAMVETVLKQIGGGNTRKNFLRSIVEGDEVHPRTNKFYRSFYWLFALIIPNIHFMTKEEFESQPSNISSSYLEYQARVIKNLIR